MPRWRTAVDAVLCGGLWCAWMVHGQSYTLDSEFHPAITTTAGTALRTVALQADGKVVMGGNFQFFHGQAFNGITRLDPYGAIDAGFQTWPGARGQVLALALQPDGKLLVGGQFTEMCGAPRNGLARLNTNGTLDTQFKPQLSGNDSFGVPFGVHVVHLRRDGGLLIGGDFKSVDGCPRSGVARLTASGRLDGSFDPGAGVEDPFALVHDLTEQDDERVLVAGFFTKFNGLTRNGLVRLLSDGTVDTNFVPDIQWTGGNALVRTLTLLPTNQILISGHFTHVNGEPRNGLARLADNGDLDLQFDPGPGVEGGVDSLVHALRVLDSGRILVGGDFERVGGLPRSGIARLERDGARDETFNPGSGMQWHDGSPAVVNDLVTEPDGSVIVVGAFERVNGVPCHHLARLGPGGGLDQDFVDETALVEKVGTVWAVAVAPDGQYLVGGQFERVDGVPRRGLARLRPGGTLDLSFAPDLGQDTVVRALVPAGTNQLLIAGEFSSVGGTLRINVARLDGAGALDQDFDPGAGPDGPVYALALQPDGQVLVGGAFDTFHNAARAGVARLDTNGVLDPDFAPQLAEKDHSMEVDTLAMQAEGRILVGGLFDHVNGEERGSLARLLPDGTLDLAFGPGLFSGSAPFVFSLALDRDGQIIVGGMFDRVDGIPREGVARLMANGPLDLAFDPGSGIGGGSPSAVYAVQTSTNNGVLIAGEFATFNGLPCANLAGLRPDGSPETTFAASQTTDSWINALATDTGGGLIVAGTFTRVGAWPRQAVARFQAINIDPQQVLDIRLTDGGPVVSWPGSGQLQYADAVDGRWEAIPGATSPYPVSPGLGAQFFRVVQ